MTNREKFREQLIEAINDGMIGDFFDAHMSTHYGYCYEDCESEEVAILITLWLEEEYKEQKVDWTQVAVDTPIYVRNSEDGDWVARHFALYAKDAPYPFVVWNAGCTSFSCGTGSTAWKFAKLAEV